MLLELLPRAAQSAHPAQGPFAGRALPLGVQAMVTVPMGSPLPTGVRIDSTEARAHDHTVSVVWGSLGIIGGRMGVQVVPKLFCALGRGCMGVCGSPLTRATARPGSRVVDCRFRTAACAELRQCSLARWHGPMPAR